MDMDKHETTRIRSVGNCNVGSFLRLPFPFSGIIRCVKSGTYSCSVLPTANSHSSVP